MSHAMLWSGNRPKQSQSGLSALLGFHGALAYRRAQQQAQRKLYAPHPGEEPQRAVPPSVCSCIALSQATMATAHSVAGRFGRDGINPPAFGNPHKAVVLKHFEDWTISSIVIDCKLPDLDLRAASNLFVIGCS